MQEQEAQLPPESPQATEEENIAELRRQLAEKGVTGSKADVVMDTLMSRLSQARVEDPNSGQVAVGAGDILKQAGIMPDENGQYEVTMTDGARTVKSKVPADMRLGIEQLAAEGYRNVSINDNRHQRRRTEALRKRKVKVEAKREARQKARKAS